MRVGTGEYGSFNKSVNLMDFNFAATALRSTQAATQQRGPGAPDDPILRSLCVVKRGGGGSHFFIYSAILCLYAGTPNSRSSCCSGVSEGAGASGAAGAAGSSGAAALAAFGAWFRRSLCRSLWGGALWRGACFSSSGGKHQRIIKRCLLQLLRVEASTHH